MKSKKTLYLLFVVVFLIWGTVFYKLLFSNTKQDHGEVPVLGVEYKMTSKKDSLLLNYRDPFLGVVLPIKTTIQETDFIDKKVFDKPNDMKPTDNLFYYGQIISRKQIYCLIGINNEQYTMRQGEMCNNFRLLNIYEDSVHLKKEGAICCIKLEK